RGCGASWGRTLGVDARKGKGPTLEGAGPCVRSRWGRLEADVKGEDRLAAGAVVGVVHAVGPGDVVLVGDVFHIELQVERVGEAVGRIRVEAPVGRGEDPVGPAARAA